MERQKKYRYIIRIVILAFILVFIFGGGYTYWNHASPEKTCISCHEINPSFHSWAGSSHREISCFECHGTALSNGWHSIKEKSGMVFSHIKADERNENIYLSEKQVLEVHDRCKNCHQDEYKAWLSGGHSADYADIFLDQTHNTTEQLNFDCLRCHGMFFEQTINELVEPINKTGPWQLKLQQKSTHPVIPCLACHQIHTEGEVSKAPDHSDPNKIAYWRNLENQTIALYSRHEKMHFPLEHLPKPKMFHKGEEVPVPSDPVYKLCVQCHAPDVSHEVGSSDDHTLIGVHAELSCGNCHAQHSNDSQNACKKCHPAVNNCGLDVTKMNTTYFDEQSENDIHFVSCKNCHDDKFLSAYGRGSL